MVREVEMNRLEELRQQLNQRIGVLVNADPQAREIVGRIGEREQLEQENNNGQMKEEPIQEVS
jgi:hypothetical protein